jgi:hypothetical protein
VSYVYLNTSLPTVSYVYLNTSLSTVFYFYLKTSLPTVLGLTEDHPANCVLGLFQDHPANCVLSRPPCQLCPIKTSLPTVSYVYLKTSLPTVSYVYLKTFLSTVSYVRRKTSLPTVSYVYLLANCVRLNSGLVEGYIHSAHMTFFSCSAALRLKKRPRIGLFSGPNSPPLPPLTDLQNLYTRPFRDSLHVTADNRTQNAPIIIKTNNNNRLNTVYAQRRPFTDFYYAVIKGSTLGYNNLELFGKNGAS